MGPAGPEGPRGERGVIGLTGPKGDMGPFGAPVSPGCSLSYVKLSIPRRPMVATILFDERQQAAQLVNCFVMDLA